MWIPLQAIYSWAIISPVLLIYILFAAIAAAIIPFLGFDWWAPFAAIAFLYPIQCLATGIDAAIRFRTPLTFPLLDLGCALAALLGVSPFLYYGLPWIGIPLGLYAYWRFLSPIKAACRVSFFNHPTIEKALPPASTW